MTSSRKPTVMQTSGQGRPWGLRLSRNIFLYFGNTLRLVLAMTRAAALRLARHLRALGYTVSLRRCEPEVGLSFYNLRRAPLALSIPICRHAGQELTR